MDRIPGRGAARFFAPIAPFVEPGSFIEFEIDGEGRSLRFEFRAGNLRIIFRELGLDDVGDWDIVEDDQTERFLGPPPGASDS